MKCLYLVLILIALVSNVLTKDTNIYKKDFDKTGKAYYFNPNDSLKDKKIVVGEECTKVVVTVKDPSGQITQPSELVPLSMAQGVYVAEIIRYPGGKCTLPNAQKYNKEVITSSPEELVAYYNGKQAPLEKYNFVTENKGEGFNIFKNKWVLIGVGSGALALILIIIIIVICSRRSSKKSDKRYSTADKDMKHISEPYIGLSNSDSNSNFTIGQPFNANASSTPLTSYNNWNTPTQDSPDMNDSNFLTPPSEPKRVNSLTLEEQQNYSNIMKKNINKDDYGSNVKKSSSFGRKNVPEEYEHYKTYKVVRKFTPQRNDELVVDPGHLVKMIKSFEDGWTLCYNIDTRREGYIPKNKLVQLDQPPQKPILHSDTTSTTSSYNSTKPLLHSSSGASSNSYYSNNNSYGRNNRRDRDREGRGVNSRNNSSGSRNGTRGSPKNPSNKYYRRPSNDNYINNGYSRNQRYDM